MASFRQLLFLCLLPVMLPACDTAFQQEPVPYAFVDKIIDMGQQQYFPLQTPGGYVDGVDGGVRGIILYRKNFSTMKAFDKNCTFDAGNPRSIVNVSLFGSYIECAFCRSTFNFEGLPTSGPANIPLKEYYTEIQGNLVMVKSDP